MPSCVSKRIGECGPRTSYMRKLIVGLAVLNLILGAYLVMGLQRQRSANRTALAGLADSSSKSNDLKQLTSKAAPKTGSGKFSWESLASPDLRRYAANLRGAGCPEQTIRDIMLAE